MSRDCCVAIPRVAMGLFAVVIVVFPDHNLNIKKKKGNDCTEILETYYWNNVHMDGPYGRPKYKYAVAFVIQLSGISVQSFPFLF